MVAPRRVKRENVSFPVAVRRSKTPLLKLPNIKAYGRVSVLLTAHKLFQFTEDLGVQLVIVNIADENDNGPLFTKKLYTGGNLFCFSSLLICLAAF